MNSSGLVQLATRLGITRAERSTAEDLVDAALHLDSGLVEDGLSGVGAACEVPGAIPAMASSLPGEQSAMILPEEAQPYVVVHAVDPRSAFVFWKVPADVLRSARVDLDDRLAPVILRVRPESHVFWDESLRDSWFDITVRESGGSYQLELWSPALSLTVELGLLGRDGRFLGLCSSRRIELPPESESGFYEVRLQPVARSSTRRWEPRSSVSAPRELFLERDVRLEASAATNLPSTGSWTPGLSTLGPDSGGRDRSREVISSALLSTGDRFESSSELRAKRARNPSVEQSSSVTESQRDISPVVAVSSPKLGDPVLAGEPALAGRAPEESRGNEYTVSSFSGLPSSPGSKNTSTHGRGISRIPDLGGIMLRGKASPDISFVVAGQMVRADREGRFEVPLPGTGARSE